MHMLMKKIALSYFITAMIAVTVILFSADVTEVQAFMSEYKKVEYECTEPNSARDVIIRCRNGGTGCQVSDQYFCDEPIDELEQN